MKTTIKLFAVLLIVISTATFAAGSENVAENEQATVRILPGSEMNVFRVLYQPTEKQSQRVKVKVSIFDAKGQLVITDWIHNEKGFVKPYNLAGRNPGAYTFQIKDRNATIDKHVVVRLQPEDMMVRVKKVDGKNRFRVLVLNPDKRMISVKIFGNWDNLIFEESISSDQGFSKVYNLSKARGNPIWGTFAFEISDDKRFLKRITL